MKSLVLLLAAAPLVAQAPAVRLIAAPDAATKPQFGNVPAVRQLPNGKVLVNDIGKRQLVLLDQSLGASTLVADSAAGAANSYGTRPGGVIAYAGDSTLFVDPAGLSMFVIDPNGKIARVASVPRSQDAPFIGNNVSGAPALDAKGRLVYRGGNSMVNRMVGGPPGGGGRGAGPTLPGGLPLPEFPDTAALVRIDLATRKLDTAGFFRIPRTKMNVQQTERGISMTAEQNPLPLVDEWAVLADGSIAIVRGQDYHVDFINADGSMSSSAKIPFEWQRLSDDDKIAIVDSAKKVMEAARASLAAGGPAAGAMAPPPDAGPRIVMNFDVGGGGGGGGGAQRMMATGGPGGGMGPVTFVSPSELPDYRPVFTPSAARGDADGNLWVRTTAARSGSAGAIYDVISRRGELIDRVQIPPGRQIVGFGKGNVVYLAARDASGTWIERTRR